MNATQTPPCCDRMGVKWPPLLKQDLPQRRLEKCGFYTRHIKSLQTYLSVP